MPSGDSQAAAASSHYVTSARGAITAFLAATKGAQTHGDTGTSDNH